MTRTSYTIISTKSKRWKLKHQDSKRVKVETPRFYFWSTGTKLTFLWAKHCTTVLHILASESSKVVAWVTNIILGNKFLASYLLQKLHGTQIRRCLTPLDLPFPTLWVWHRWVCGNTQTWVSKHTIPEISGYNNFWLWEKKCPLVKL